MPNPLQRAHLLGMVSGAAIWAAHFLLSYLFVSLACAYGYAQWHLLGLNLTVLGMGLITLTALALLLYTAAINYRKWRREPVAATDMAPGPFIALHSMLLCALASLAVVWVAFPALLLPPCAS